MKGTNVPSNPADVQPWLESKALLQNKIITANIVPGINYVAHGLNKMPNGWYLVSAKVKDTKSINQITNITGPVSGRYVLTVGTSLIYTYAIGQQLAFSTTTDFNSVQRRWQAVIVDRNLAAGTLTVMTINSPTVYDLAVNDYTFDISPIKYPLENASAVKGTNENSLCLFSDKAYIAKISVW